MNSFGVSGVSTARRFPVPSLPGSFNSLFWRLFSGLIAVILITAAATWGAAYVVQSQIVARLENTLSLHYGGQRVVETAFIMHRYAGEAGLIEWLRSDANTRPTVFVMTKDGVELSGRTVPERARQLLDAMQQGKPHRDLEKDIPAGAVKTVEIDGKPYFIFAVHTKPPVPRLNIFPFNSLMPAATAIVSILLLTLCVAWTLALYYSRPLRRLDAAMRKVAEGDLSTRIEKDIGPADGEVAALAKVFDRMADQIEKLIKRQRKLFHNVSHEIRSPLARIEVAVELAKMDPNRVASSLERIEKEVRAIDELIGSLLTYARLEGGIKLETAPVSMRTFLSAIRDTLAFEAQGRAIKVNFIDRLDQDVTLNINEAALSSALINIGRNALRYTPQAGTITLIAERRARGLLLRCIDEGPGMPSEELARMFDPFVRGNREQTGTGFGLGLAIAKSAIESQQGEISAKNILPHGLEFDILLPAERSSPR